MMKAYRFEKQVATEVKLCWLVIDLSRRRLLDELHLVVGADEVFRSVID